MAKAFTNLLVKGAGEDSTSSVINISAGLGRMLGTAAMTSVSALSK